MSTRTQKVEHLLKSHIAEIIQREIKDPRLGFVTVTDVKVTPDLKYARVYVSVFGSEEQQKDGLAVLKRSAGFVRGLIGKRIRMRVTPEIDFRIDTSIDKGMHIFELLQQVKQEEPQQEEPKDDE